MSELESKRAVSNFHWATALSDDKIAILFFFVQNTCLRGIEHAFIVTISSSYLSTCSTSLLLFKPLYFNLFAHSNSLPVWKYTFTSPSNAALWDYAILFVYCSAQPSANRKLLQAHSAHSKPPNLITSRLVTKSLLYTPVKLCSHFPSEPQRPPGTTSTSSSLSGANRAIL